MDTHVTKRQRRAVATLVLAAALLATLPALGEEPGPAGAEPSVAATAQGPTPLAAALERLRPGQNVRITTTDKETTEGRLAAIHDGRLLFEGSKLAARFPDGVPLANVEKAWVRGRATKTGALTGGALGGVATAALFGIFVYALCEVDSCRDDWPAGAVIGLALGGTAGALTGSLIGAASPEWHAVSGRSVGAPAAGPDFVPFVSPGASHRGSIGSASLHLGYGKGLDALAGGGAAGWRLNLMREGGALGRHLELRPSLEIGHQGLGQRLYFPASSEPQAYGESLTYLGPAVALGAARGAVRPYALGSVGYYRWRFVTPAALDAYPEYAALEPVYRVQLDEGLSPTLTHGLLGGSLGGGVRIDTGGPLSFGVEGRWHTNITRGPWMGGDASYRRLSLFSVTGGATWRW